MEVIHSNLHPHYQAEIQCTFLETTAGNIQYLGVMEKRKFYPH